MPITPYKIVALTNGLTAPFHIVRYDQEGRCISPQTAAEIVKSVKEGAYTDMILFSHGWNNDWKAATERYDAFLQNYQSMMTRRGLKIDREFKPVLVGIFWPSTALVMPWESAPEIAADGVGAAGASYQAQMDEVAKLIPSESVEKFYDLVTRDSLDKVAGLELANILAPLYMENKNQPEDAPGKVTPENLYALWKEDFPANGDKAAPVSDDFGFAKEDGVKPAVAGFLEYLNPRNVVRAFTVWQMKDRAGTVGGNGVHRLLAEVLEADSNIRVHMLGHSYGAKVVLSAICAGSLPRKVESLLLLQPAINSWCFALNVWGKGFSGGYRSAFDKVKQPILSTFTMHDKPLTQFFHVAVRRTEDLGEVKILAEAPSKYAALGGFGPQGLGGDQLQEIKMLAPGGDRYELAGAGTTRIYGVKSDSYIFGHGDIVTEGCSWALFCQLAAVS